MSLFHIYFNPAQAMVAWLMVRFPVTIWILLKTEDLDIVWPCPPNINVHIGAIINYDMLMYGQGGCGSWNGDFNKLQKL